MATRPDNWPEGGRLIWRVLVYGAPLAAATLAANAGMQAWDQWRDFATPFADTVLALVGFAILTVIWLAPLLDRRSPRGAAVALLGDLALAAVVIGWAAARADSRWLNELIGLAVATPVLVAHLLLFVHRRRLPPAPDTEDAYHPPAAPLD